jgi:hypothetical protein
MSSGSGELDTGAEQLTVEQWRAALPGPLRTPGMSVEAVLRLAYLAFADNPGASPDLARFEEWQERRVTHGS